ncbi:hypothetical protein EFK50_20715 [Nocardioides marmoriginsengisoli]|uniref:Uncharacterized protein n=1 Tax=Nocardioides marmoriginsengisoli TaxID=661483 RepID=A0A3N0CBA5_9ACTN|nr:hypothetical protein EFK50_20715 [Nocardioides marmoriginsengisoli]
MPPEYGAPPAGAGGYDAVEAIKYGWATFTKSPATLLVPALVVILAVGVVSFLAQLLFAGILIDDPSCSTSTGDGAFRVSCDSGSGLFTGLLVAALASAVTTFVGQILAAGLIKSSLNIVDGQPALDIGGVFSWAGKPGVIATAGLLAALSFVGTFLFYVPAIIVSFFTAFAMYFVVDKGLSGVAALKASFDFMLSKIGDTIIFFLLTIATVIVGLIACLVGIFVAIPVIVVAAAYTFRVLQNQPVAPLAP